jgi:hypothetical protein
MRALSAADLLSVWEIGRRQQPTERALTMLAAAWPESRREELAELSIGERDARLLTIRAQIFGTRLESRGVCPQCGEAIELSLDANEILALPKPDTLEVSMTDGEFFTRFRLPNSLDVAEAAAAPDVDGARQTLLARCVLTAEKGGERISGDQLPNAAVKAVTARMSEADPAADVNCEINCPNCCHTWSMLFDIVSFFWREIESRALRLLHEVHTLASAYGWREPEILALNPLRRQHYLEMVGE